MRSRTATVFLVVLIVVGVAAVTWAIFSSSGSCVRIAQDVGGCTDNTPVKRAVGLIGVVFLVVPALLLRRVTVTRR